MIFQRKGNLHLYRWDSFEEYLDRAANPAYKKRLREDYYYRSGYGKPAFQTQLHNARHGWTEVTVDIAKWATMLIEDVSTHLPKPEMAFDKEGSFWDLDRVIHQDPDCWIYEQPGTDLERSGRGNVVKMVINTASSAVCRTNAHKYRCGAIVALATLLEKCGFYVQFDITTAIQLHNYKKLEFRTIAKKASEPFNLATLTYWCSEYMERHIDFAICETLNECASLVGENKFKQPCYSIDYGYPMGTIDPGDICFDRIHATEDGVDWNDESSVRHYIIEKLKQQGIKIQS